MAWTLFAVYFLGCTVPLLAVAAIGGLVWDVEHQPETTLTTPLPESDTSGNDCGSYGAIKGEATTEASGGLVIRKRMSVEEMGLPAVTGQSLN